MKAKKKTENRTENKTENRKQRKYSLGKSISFAQFGSYRRSQNHRSTLVHKYVVKLFSSAFL